MTASLTSRRPYLLRAMHQWMMDNAQTPHVVVDATVEGVAVPPQHVQSGRIVLNIGDGATGDLHIGNDALDCTARFSGVAMNLHIPMEAILGIYARESGQGMIFTRDQDPVPPGDEPGGKPQLKIVK